MTTPTLTALVLNCTLSPSPVESSTELLAQQVLDALAQHDVTGNSVRVVDHDVRPGVALDMGDGDEWPQIRAQIMEADILLIATPTWTSRPRRRRWLRLPRRWPPTRPIWLGCSTRAATRRHDRPDRDVAPGSVGSRGRPTVPPS